MHNTVLGALRDTRWAIPDILVLRCLQQRLEVVNTRDLDEELN